MLFLTLAWRKWLLRVSQNFFVFFYPEYLAFGSVSLEPCPTTNFFTIYFRWREGFPTSVLGSQPIVWLLHSSFQCQATQVRSPSINICGSPLCDLHSFLTVTLWGLLLIQTLGIVLILFLSSRWDITWQYKPFYLKQFSLTKVHSLVLFCP